MDILSVGLGPWRLPSPLGNDRGRALDVEFGLGPEPEPVPDTAEDHVPELPGTELWGSRYCSDCGDQLPKSPASANQAQAPPKAEGGTGCGQHGPPLFPQAPWNADKAPPPRRSRQ